MYTIKKGNLYVKDSKFCNMNSQSSYTTNPQEAVKFSTYDEAKKNSCVENEVVVKMTMAWM